MKKIIKEGVVVAIVMIVFNLLFNFVFNLIVPTLQDQYMSNPVFRPWEDPIMMLFFLYPLALGIALAWVWNKTKQLFKGSCWKNGYDFGMIFFFVYCLPIFLINYSSFNLPFVMILSWTLMSVLNGFVAGTILAKINK